MLSSGRRCSRRTYRQGGPPRIEDQPGGRKCFPHSSFPQPTSALLSFCRVIVQDNSSFRSMENNGLFLALCHHSLPSIPTCQEPIVNIMSTTLTNANLSLRMNRKIDQDGDDAAGSEVQEQGGRVHGIPEEVQHPGQELKEYRNLGPFSWNKPASLNENNTSTFFPTNNCSITASIIIKKELWKRSFVMNTVFFWITKRKRGFRLLLTTGVSGYDLTLGEAFSQHCYWQNAALSTYEWPV